MSGEINVIVKPQIIYVEPTSGSIQVVGPKTVTVLVDSTPGFITVVSVIPPTSPLPPDIVLPLNPTDIGPGEPSPYAVYTDTGWQAPPTSNHFWSGSGWVLLSGAVLGLARSVEDSYTPTSFAATDGLTVVLGSVAGGEILIPSASDTFTPYPDASTDSVTVVLT